jgi:RNA polymerase sigma factor (sigma-70 family)
VATRQTSEVLQHLRRAVVLRDGVGLTDGQLLEDYLSRRDDAALAALVWRHGPMVWGVCRRVLRNHHDAEDAFQATFLVLVRKAAAVVPREMVANWLYGVAHRTVLKARATSAKRRVRERHVAEMPEPFVTEPDHWHDLQPLFDRALSRLPEKYRIAIVLCELEGKTRKEAARQLGVPEGTLAARVARGRVMLAKRLARHGIGISSAALAVVLAQNVASASVPSSVVSSTINAASLFAAGPAAAASLIPSNAVALAHGVMKAMFLTKLKIAAAVLFATGILCIAVGGLAGNVRAGLPGSQDAGSVRALVPGADESKADAKPRADKDDLKGSWTVVSLEERGTEVPEEEVKERNAEMVFTGDKVTLPIKGGSKEAEYKLDSSKKPKEIDFVLEGKTHKGIYLLEKDTLKVCVQKDADGERPTKFATAGTSNVQYGLARKK